MFITLTGVFGIFDSLGRINGIPDPSGMAPAVVMVVVGLALIIWGVFAGVLSRWLSRRR
jgi:hypothetical protein